MKPITKELIRIYEPQGMCWLGYQVTRDNPYTFHHIKKAEHGGLYTLDNGGLITSIGHSYLHIIEYKDFEIYLKLNKFIKMINEQQSTPTKEQYQLTNDCLKYFEREHDGERTRKGKLIVKPEFKEKRLIYQL